MEEDRYRRLFEAAQEIIWAHRDGVIILANPFAARFVGADSPEALVGRQVMDFVHPEDRELSRRRAAQALAHRGMLPPVELRVLRRDGVATVEFRAQTFDDPGGPAVLGIGRDVSDRVAAQAAARESQQLLSAFMEHAPFAMFVKTLEGRYVLMNREARRVLGVLERDIHGLADRDLLSPASAEQSADHDRQVVETAAVATREGPSVFGYGWSLAIRFPLHDAAGAVTGIGGFEIDLSERRRLEEQLERSARLEAVGRLTGGMAHDFNNLLTVIFGNLERSLDPDADPATMRTGARSALAAAERGAALTRQLLAFARRQPLAPTAFDLNERVRAMGDMLRRTLGETIELRWRLDPDLAPALADPTQVESALINLAINARDAMPRGGRLTIETANTHLDELSFSAGEVVAPGEYVMLAVSDTGTGMTPEVLRRAVEPFFTTKEVGKGSGLGLSMVYGFARQSGGYLKLYSEPGRGTTVRLFLPRADAASGQRTAPAPADGPPRGSETVLVVEDDADVRRIVATQIASLGYRVLETADGHAALAVLEEEPGIELLFTDVVMPGGMSGPRLVELAKRRRPDLKVLFTTGYTEEAVTDAGGIGSAGALLPKPYSKLVLARKLREVLDG
ncbi:MAG: PAS domain S-box protein [Rhodospirillaceae bacterium]|nr:PAS domain S-box protein [Rhodospirillaceae bacterium]